MKIVQPSVSFIGTVDGDEILRHIEECGRTCYQSEWKIADGTAAGFVRNIIKRGHESVLEHKSVTVRFVCDRGVSHEIVRHRIASYSQESTRYCNYANDQFGREISVIEPSGAEPDSAAYRIWKNLCMAAQGAYLSALDAGQTPQQARAVLPNSLKTTVVMTANMREWRHFLKLRCDKAAHPDMRRVALMLLRIFHAAVPVIFDDIAAQYADELEVAA